MERIVGIDFGTTSARVGAIIAGRPCVIRNRDGAALTPTVVAFPDGPEAPRTGADALPYLVLRPADTITGIKQFLGRTYNEVVDLVEQVPFRVVPGPAGRVAFDVAGRLWSPEEVAALVIRELKTRAEAVAEEAVASAVVTVPATFSDPQRRATVRAFELAGLKVRRLVAEPCAAALGYYESQRPTAMDATVAVIDLGGGTFDVTFVEVGDGVTEIRGVSGDGYLGGRNFDERILQWILDELERARGTPLTDPQVGGRLRWLAVEAKHELSEATEARIAVDLPGEPGFERVLTRTVFEDLTAELLQRVRRALHAGLARARKQCVRRADIQQVILVGGASRMPMIGRVAREVFGDLPLRVFDPDEAVVIGATVLAGVLGGRVSDALLLDVLPHSVGVERLDGTVEVLFPCGTTIPTSRRTRFVSADVATTAVEVHVLQGERELAVENLSLGRIALDGLVAPAEVDVRVDIDANHMILVEVRDPHGSRRVRARLRHR